MFDLGKNQRSKNLVIHLAAAIVVVVIQVLAQPIFLTILGNTTSSETWILALVMLGICLGQSRLIGGWGARATVLASGLICLSLGFFYSSLMLNAVSSFYGKKLGMGALLVLVVSAGLLSSEAIYADGVFRKNYFRHNFLCAVGIGSCFVLQLLFGNHAVALFCGGALLLVGCSGLLTRASEVLPRNNLGLVSWESVFLGTISGVFLLCILELISLSVVPTGLEFHFYLFFIFLHLAVNSSFTKRVDSGIKPWAAFLLLLLILVGTFGGMPDGFFLDLALIAKNSANSELKTTALSLGLIGLYLLPYYFFSATVPFQQKVGPNKNHLFSVSLGNFLGIVIPTLLFQKPSLEWLVVGFFILAMLYETKDRRGAKIILCSSLLFGLSFFFLQEPVRRVLTQAARLGLSLDGVPLQSIYEKSFVKSYFRMEGKTGYLYQEPGGVRSLGLGGYSSPMRQFFDIVKAKTVSELAMARKAKRILILGLGNQLTISELIGPDLRQALPDLQVDVVENFPPLAVKEFQNEIGSIIGLRGPIKNVRLIEDDAFDFLANRKYEGPYDIVVNNLTWPVYLGSRLLYTKEFFELVKDALTQDGYFVARPFKELELDCLPKVIFPFSVSYPFSARLLSLSISSMSPLIAEMGPPIGDLCKKVELPSLAKLFWGQNMHDQADYRSARNNSRDIVLREAGPSLLNLQPLKLLFLSWFYSRDIGAKVLIFPQSSSQNQESIQEIQKAAAIFRINYGAPVVEVRSLESDASALAMYSYVRSAFRNSLATSIIPYFHDKVSAKDLDRIPKPTNFISYSIEKENSLGDVPLVTTAANVEAIFQDLVTLASPTSIEKFFVYVEKGYREYDLPFAVREKQSNIQVFHLGIDHEPMFSMENKNTARVFFFRSRKTYLENVERITDTKLPQVLVFSPEADIGDVDIGPLPENTFLLSRPSPLRGEILCKFLSKFSESYKKPPSALAASVYAALLLASQESAASPEITDFFHPNARYATYYGRKPGKRKNLYSGNGTKIIAGKSECLTQ